jgi:hypothetical protein
MKGKDVLLALAASLALGAACGSSTGARDAPAGVTDGPDAAPALDCRGIRNCVHACGSDVPCTMRCLSSASAVARAYYEKIPSCSAQACPSQDVVCRCEAECHPAGVCADLVDTCDLANPDDFCDPMGPCGI